MNETPEDDGKAQLAMALQQVLARSAELDAAATALPAQPSETPPGVGAELEDARQRLSALGTQLRAAIGGGPLGRTELARMQGLAAVAAIQAGDLVARVQPASPATLLDALARQAETTARSHRLAEEMHRALFEERIYDPYLSFASVEAEAAYREREAARREVDADLAARGKAPAAVRARLENLLEQLEDAGRHGADRHPGWHRRREELRDGVEQLHTTDIAVSEGRDGSINPPPAPSETLRAAGVTPSAQDGPPSPPPPIESGRPGRPPQGRPDRT